MIQIEFDAQEIYDEANEQYKAKFGQTINLLLPEFSKVAVVNGTVTPSGARKLKHYVSKLDKPVTKADDFDDTVF